MKLIQEINILESKKLAIVLNLLAIPLWIIFGYVFSWVVVLLSQVVNIKDSHTFSGWDGLWFFLAFMILLVIHELIHGLFFKAYKPENKVKFGIKWKQGMAYATSPGSQYNRGQMLVISLAPFVLLSLALTILLALGGINVGMYILLASAHAAGCIGDFYYTYLLTIKHRKENILVEDTETGLLIYQA